MIGHAIYLDHLGFADVKQFPDFQSDDKLLAFRHILHDFSFLIEDFFDGSCNKLIEAAAVQEAMIKEYNEKIQLEAKYDADRTRIKQARQLFLEKRYRQCVTLYNSLAYKHLLIAYDTKILAYSLKQA